MATKPTTQSFEGVTKFMNWLVLSSVQNAITGLRLICASGENVLVVLNGSNGVGSRF